MGYKWVTGGLQVGYEWVTSWLQVRYKRVKRSYKCVFLVFNYCYYPQMPRDSVSTISKIFFGTEYLSMFHNIILYYNIFSTQVSFTAEYYKLGTGDR